MNRSQAFLLSNAIDYAGTFPPARLPLDEALRQGAGFRRSARFPWLLAKFALALSDIQSLHSQSLFDTLADGSAWVFAALGTSVPDESPERFLPTLEADAKQIQFWNAAHRDSVCPRRIAAYETRLPLSFLKDADLLVPALERLKTLFENQHPSVVTYLEIPKGENWETALQDAAVLFSKAESARWGGMGLKFRTGGALVPTAEEVARVLTVCATYQLKFKATQGLHHALTGASGLGFVNLFAALNFRVHYQNQFSTTYLVDCLNETDSKKFIFEESRFAWRDFSMTLEQIDLARQHHAACFGSCSLIEPDESLEKEFPLERESSK